MRNIKTSLAILSNLQYDISMNAHLPISIQDLKERNISQLDFVYVIGDAYVDHPSFGHAIISRVLEAAGYSVGIIAQPDWHSCIEFQRLGRPRLAFLVSSGNIDPMVNHYTAAKKIRNTDLYSPGGEAGHRPDRATVVYCNRIREAYGRKVPILIGGIEASLRRFAHYDYWSDRVRRSILIDSGADLLLFGMGERQIVEVAALLQAGVPSGEIKHVCGTMYLEGDANSLPENCIRLPDYDTVCADKRAYAAAAMTQYQEQDAVRGRPLAQLDRDKYTVQNPPARPLNTAELDAVYDLPYTRTYHPVYEAAGGVPALKEVEFSITSCRGCFGGCNFCALTFHQGRTVTSRSHDSILREAELLTKNPRFKGYIHDVGGPTANFRAPSCTRQLKHGVCKNRQCLFPEPCQHLEASHRDYLSLLEKLRRLKGIKRVFIRSGIRYDYLLADPDDAFFYALCKYHVSGQLKVAPEHISDHVLYYMGKPGRAVYDRFVEKYERINATLQKKQYLVPYLMSSHPGSTLKDAIRLAEFLRDHHLNPEQVQDFYPTPGSLSTCMYYTGLDPRTMKPVYVPRDYREKQMQRALLQYRKPENYELVRTALLKAGRADLIGNHPKCLIHSKKGEQQYGKATERKDRFRKGQRRTETGGRSPERKRDHTGSGGRHRRRRSGL